MRSRGRVAATALALCTALGSAALATSSPVRGGPYRVLQLNVCGNARNPECRVEGSLGAPVDAIVDLVVGVRPDVVTLQEVCSDQVAAVRSRAAARGRPMHTVFTPVWTSSTLRCRERAQGIALLSRGPLSDVTTTCLARCTLPTSAVEHRDVTCATTSLLVRTRVCVTHVGRRDQAAQLRRLTAVVDAEARAGPIVLGGDLNTAPFATGLDGLYASGAPASSGRFDEADACLTRRGRTPACNVGTLDAPGADVKLDYVFGSRRDVTELDARTVRMAWSDHDAVLATFFQCTLRGC